MGIGSQYVMPMLFVDILAICATLIALLVPVALWRQRLSLERLEQRVEQQTQTLLAIQGAAKVLSGEAVTHREDLARVRKVIDRLAQLNQEMRLELRLRDADNSPYTQAIKLIRHGQPRSEVRKLCSLTDSEVDLLFNLHGQGIAPGLDSEAAADDDDLWPR